MPYLCYDPQVKKTRRLRKIVDETTQVPVYTPVLAKHSSSRSSTASRLALIECSETSNRRGGCLAGSAVRIDSRVFQFRVAQLRNFVISIGPHGEELLISPASRYTITRRRECTGKAKARERVSGRGYVNSRVSNDLLEFRHGFGALP